MPEDKGLRVFKPEAMDRYYKFLCEAAGDRSIPCMGQSTTPLHIMVCARLLGASSDKELGGIS